MSQPPSRGRWTDRYGVRVNPVTKRTEGHHGLDINSAAGLFLVAPEDGAVISFGVIDGWEVHGRVLIILGRSGWVHWLSHCNNALIDKGAPVREGQTVAVMGLTGQTDGLHVHWETRLDGKRLNPEDWLARTAGHAEPEAPTPIPETPKRKKRPMIHAAYRDDTGTIAVQARPGGRLTQLTGPLEWQGLAAASGAEYAQINNAQMQALGAQFGGFLTSPNFDDARTGQGATILVPADGQPDRYATLGDRAYWIDQATMDDMLAKGAIQVRVPREEIDARTKVE